MLSPFNHSRFFQPGYCRHFRLDNFIFHLLYYASFLFEREDAKSKALSRLYHTLSEAHYAAFIKVNERTSPSSKKKEAQETKLLCPQTVLIKLKGVNFNYIIPQLYCTHITKGLNEN